MAAPKVASAKLDTALNAVFKFSDGHKLVLVYNDGGFGESSNIEAAYLEHGKKLLANYNSPNQYPRNRFKIGFTTKECSLKFFVSYWRAANDYADDRSKRNIDHDLWREVCKGHSDLEKLEADAKKEKN